MVEISVIICTRNRPQKLKRCLSSILENDSREMELFIIDQSDNGETETVVDSLSDRRLIFKRIRIKGLARARNFALALTRGRIVTFTDDDCIVDKDWIKNILLEFSLNPEAGAVYGRILPYGDIKKDMFCHAVNESLDFEIVDRPVLPHSIGHGNNMSFRREIFREIGDFENIIGAGTRFYAGEDTDFTLRLMERGFKIVYSPRPLVYHDKWHSLRESRVLDYKYLLGATIVFGKHLILKRNKVALIWLLRRFWEIGSHLKFAIRDKDLSRAGYVLKMYCFYFIGILVSFYLVLSRRLHK